MDPGFNEGEKAYFRMFFLCLHIYTFLCNDAAISPRICFLASHKSVSFLLPGMFFGWAPNPIAACSDHWGNATPGLGLLHKGDDWSKK